MSCFVFGEIEFCRFTFLADELSFSVSYVLGVGDCNRAFILKEPVLWDKGLITCFEVGERNSSRAIAGIACLTGVSTKFTWMSLCSLFLKISTVFCTWSFSSKTSPNNYISALTLSSLSFVYTVLINFSVTSSYFAYGRISASLVIGLGESWGLHCVSLVSVIGDTLTPKDWYVLGAGYANTATTKFVSDFSVTFSSGALVTFGLWVSSTNSS